jgi:hypothetical protein
MSYLFIGSIPRELATNSNISNWRYMMSCCLYIYTKEIQIFYCVIMLVKEVVIAYVVRNVKSQKGRLNACGYACFTLIIKINISPSCFTNTSCCNPEWRTHRVINTFLLNLHELSISTFF